jgi:phosphoenolpyruvate synthase/pyruvate phosphate dikinase
MAQRLRPERDDALQGLFDEFLNKYTGTYKNVPSASEYGIPCVTGVPEAFELIETGDILTVDGYQGIVTIEKRYLQKN